MNININKEVCIGCGACAAVCPEVFEMGADGKAQAKVDAQTDLPCFESAKTGCPVSAISVEL